MAKDGCNFELTLIGDGPERSSLEALTESLGLSGRVTFAGELQRQRVDEELRTTDVVVMPSLWEETAGLAAMEQMMTGGRRRVRNWWVGRSGGRCRAQVLCGRRRRAIFPPLANCKSPQRTGAARFSGSMRALSQFSLDRLFLNITLCIANSLINGNRREFRLVRCNPISSRYPWRQEPYLEFVRTTEAAANWMAKAYKISPCSAWY